MTVKPKQFPLNLSSLTNKRDESQTPLRAGVTASRQTAMQNAMQHHGTGISTKSSPAFSTPTSSRTTTSSMSSLSVDAFKPAQATESIRDAMVKRVAQQGVKDQLVLSALRGVQRHLFIEPGLSGQAYVDASIPIGHHQTISQPYIVARMIEIMRNGAALQRVLEIGSGCGYQAAVLSLVAKDVYSIERIKALHELAKNNLRPMRIPNIRLHYGDGMLGLPHVAPFDGIILAAAGLEVPQALLDQLAIGGRLIAPVGARTQVLELIVRTSRCEWKRSVMEQCHFVPLRPGLVS